MIFSSQTQSATSHLPIQLGIRLALDAVSYSNPLPEWFDPIIINYSARETAIRRRVAEYLDGTQPKRPFEIMVPKRSGVAKRWAVPTVNDRIVLQACVSSIGEQLDRCIDHKRVFSYRYNSDPNRLELTENQIEAWSQFQEETNRRCRSADCILQIDLEDAFGAIDRSQFAAFLRRVVPDSPVPPLLSRLLDAFASGKGLPLINDSVFVLGNAYLSEVDQIITRHTTNYIRFVDDYRIFDMSPTKLELLLSKIGSDLANAGFHVNASKIRLGTGRDYLEAIAQLKYAEKDTRAGYFSAVIFRDIVPPDKLMPIIERTVMAPGEYLNEGLGRFILASLRRMRMNMQVAENANFYTSPGRSFAELLSGNSSTLKRIVELLRSYAPTEVESWRSVWLLYVAQDIDETFIEDRQVRGELDKIRSDISHSRDVPTIVKLWARGIRHPDKLEKEIETLHDLDYADQGIRCCEGPNA